MKNLEIKNLEISYFRFYEDGFCVGWTCNIGWGRMDFIMDEKGKFRLDTETMCSNEDKEFAEMVLEKAKDYIIRNSEVNG